MERTYEEPEETSTDGTEYFDIEEQIGDDMVLIEATGWVTRIGDDYEIDYASIKISYWNGYEWIEDKLKHIKHNVIDRIAILASGL